MSHARPNPDAFTRRTALWQSLCGSAMVMKAWCTGTTAHAEFPTSPQAVTNAAIDRGLTWLATRQKEDGGFGRPGAYARNVGVCALAGLAFLSHQGPRGRFEAPIRGCTDYLLAQSRPGGFIVEDEVKTHAPMYGHGFATLFLSQICGADTRPELRDTLKRAVNLIIGAQGPRGAWQYTPSPDDADVSVTTCQMLALCSAQQAGLAIPAETFARSVNFVLSCQNPDGGFRYRCDDPPESLFPRSAAATVALHAASSLQAVGLPIASALTRARDYLAAPNTVPAPAHAEYYYYGRYYAAHAAWQQGPTAWNGWFAVARDELLARQTTDGNWHDLNIGNEYATAMALNVLQLPRENLPLYLL